MTTKAKAKKSKMPKMQIYKGGRPIWVSNGRIVDSGKQTLLHLQHMIAFIESSGDWVHQAQFEFTILTEKK